MGKCCFIRKMFAAVIFNHFKNAKKMPKVITK